MQFVYMFDLCCLCLQICSCVYLFCLAFGPFPCSMLLMRFSGLLCGANNAKDTSKAV
jgi:hypothetical protein